MFYGFLCASLPTLACGIPTEFSLDEFDGLAREALPVKEFDRLVSRDSGADKCAVYRSMRQFEEYLKLRIAGERQEKLGSFNPLPEPDELFSDVDFALPAAAAADDPLERERMVDAICWQKIDELECEHQFDLDYLCCYRMRLSLLEKYRRRAENNGTQLFEQAVDRLSEPISKI